MSDADTNIPSPTFIVTEGMGAGPSRPGSYNYKVSPITATDEGEEDGVLFELYHDPTLTGVEGRLAFAIQMSADEADELAEMLTADGGGVGPAFVEEDDAGPGVDDDEDDEALTTEELEAKQKRREARHGVPLSPGDALKKQGAPLVDKKNEHGQRKIARPSGERAAARSAKANKGGEPAHAPRRAGEAADEPAVETGDGKDGKEAEGRKHPAKADEKHEKHEKHDKADDKTTAGHSSPPAKKP